MSKTYDKEKRRKVFEEIIETEEKYLHALDLLNKNYIQPLKKNKYLKFGRELNTIVSNLTVIVNFNSHLLAKLKSASEDDIGKTFQMVVPFLKTYTQYFSNYEAALNSIREADKNPKNKRFSEWLKKTDDRSKELGQQTFKQLLIQPVQRIPRYNLLIQEVLKNTPKTHVDYKPLQEAGEKMREVADHLNKQITEIENRNRLVKLKEMFVLNSSGKGTGITNIVEPHRKYVFEGELNILSETTVKANPQKCFFFLFSDLFLCCNEITNEEVKKKLIEERINKLKQQNGQDKKKPAKGLRIFGNKDDEQNNSSDGSFDEDENFIPEHFYTIKFTIKFSTDIKTGLSPNTLSPVDSKSPLISPSPNTLDINGAFEEFAWVRDFNSFECKYLNLQNVFQLITPKETYTFECKDEKTKDKWMQHFNNTLEEFKKKTKTLKEKAKAKSYPIVLQNNATLVIQALSKGFLTRAKKGDIGSRYVVRGKNRRDTSFSSDNLPLLTTKSITPTSEEISISIPNNTIENEVKGSSFDSISAISEVDQSSVTTPQIQQSVDESTSSSITPQDDIVETTEEITKTDEQQQEVEPIISKEEIKEETKDVPKQEEPIQKEEENTVTHDKSVVEHSIPVEKQEPVEHEHKTEEHQSIVTSHVIVEQKQEEVIPKVEEQKVETKQEEIVVQPQQTKVEEENVSTKVEEVKPIENKEEHSTTSSSVNTEPEEEAKVEQKEEVIEEKKEENVELSPKEQKVEPVEEEKEEEKVNNNEESTVKPSKINKTQSVTTSNVSSNDNKEAKAKVPEENKSATNKIISSTGTMLETSKVILGKVEESSSKSPREDDEEVFYDEEGNILPPWKVELMKRFKKYGKFNNVIATDQQKQQQTSLREKKIDIPKKNVQLNAIRSMFEEKDKQAKTEMSTLRRKNSKEEVKQN